MFNNLDFNPKWLPKKTALGKYFLIFLITTFIIMLCGQLIAQLFTVRQFDKVTGTVVKREIRQTSYSAGNRFKNGDANYSLIVTLDNGHAYNIDLDQYSTVEENIKKTDKISIYNPTLIYNILSLDILDSDGSVLQVELDNNIILNFDQHKHKAWSFICYTLIAIGVFFYLFRNLE